MLANLKNIFNPSAVVQSLKPLPPLKSTVMDTFSPTVRRTLCQCSASAS